MTKQTVDDDQIEASIREHFAAREEVEPTPFTSLWKKTEHQKPTRYRCAMGILAIAATVALIGVTSLVSQSEQSELDADQVLAQGNKLFLELASSSAWRAPSDRLTEEYMQLPAWGTTSFDLPQHDLDTES
ncbi:MAG: hypothetical protein GKR90_16065 [Pseudomonadales bacterium]|nr:hypothetical protein [Pseudomonadales bacterium]